MYTSEKQGNQKPKVETNELVTAKILVTMFTGTSQALYLSTDLKYELNMNKPVQSNTRLWFLWEAETLNKQETF